MPAGPLCPHATCCLSFPSCEIRIVRLSSDSVVLTSDKITKAKCSTHRLAHHKDSVNGGDPPPTLSCYDYMSRVGGGPQFCPHDHFSAWIMSVLGRKISGKILPRFIFRSQTGPPISFTIICRKFLTFKPDPV